MTKHSGPVSEGGCAVFVNEKGEAMPLWRGCRRPTEDWGRWWLKKGVRFHWIECVGAVMKIEGLTPFERFTEVCKRWRSKTPTPGSQKLALAHPFGDHSNCDEEACPYVDGSKKKMTHEDLSVTCLASQEAVTDRVSGFTDDKAIHGLTSGGYGLLESQKCEAGNDILHIFNPKNQKTRAWSYARGVAMGVIHANSSSLRRNGVLAPPPFDLILEEAEAVFGIKLTMAPRQKLFTEQVLAQRVTKATHAATEKARKLQAKNRENNRRGQTDGKGGETYKPPKPKAKAQYATHKEGEAQPGKRIGKRTKADIQKHIQSMLDNVDSKIPELVLANHPRPKDVLKKGWQGKTISPKVDWMEELAKNVTKWHDKVWTAQKAQQQPSAETAPPTTAAPPTNPPPTPTPTLTLPAATPTPPSAMVASVRPRRKVAKASNLPGSNPSSPVRPAKRRKGASKKR